MPANLTHSSAAMKIIPRHERSSLLKCPASSYTHRCHLASSVLSSLQRIWSDRYLCLPTKVRVYQTLVLPILTYACETWTLLAADIKGWKLSTCNANATAKIRWQEHNVEHRHILSDKSLSYAGSNCLSFQLTVWTCRHHSPQWTTLSHVNCEE